MSSYFCCSSIQPYRPQRLDHESKFTSFMAWASNLDAQGVTEPLQDSGAMDKGPSFAVQLVRQVNYGRLESKRYFVHLPDQGNTFAEVSEGDLISCNFQKLNSYKNFKCSVHDRFFEVNLYQKDPTNKHHWRANLARPASEIDL